jgi:hypothetical protein
VYDSSVSRLAAPRFALIPVALKGAKWDDVNADVRSKQALAVLKVLYEQYCARKAGK